MRTNSSGGGASSSTASLVLHAGALVAIYSIYSILQEKVMKTSYGTGDTDEHRFTSSALLVLSNRLFSLVAGLAFSLLLPIPGQDLGSLAGVKGSANEALTELRRKRIDLLRPTWPLHFYALVAAANFMSTFCQYEALRWVGFTTQALAKCAKMVPVLLLGRVVYSKTYKTKEYVAGAVVVVGCCTYLFSGTSPVRSTHATANAPTETSTFTAAVGAGLLACYLFFDGITSTTQEHYFGKTKGPTSSSAAAPSSAPVDSSSNASKPAPAHPLMPGGPVLDQMIHVNACAALISLVCCFLEVGKFGSSLALMWRSREVCIDVALLSATATFGLVVLYDTIFKHGALNVATVMTLRQFFSIVLNAGIFGHLDALGFRGWLGVGLVAAGVFIKMDRRFDKPRPLAVQAAETSTGEKGLTQAVHQLPFYTDPRETGGVSDLRLLSLQYGVPLAMPFAFATFFWFDMAGPTVA